MERDMARHKPDQAGHVNLPNSNIKIEALKVIPAIPVADARIVSDGGSMERDVARPTPDHAGHVILDNDNMKIEEVRGPDHLDQQGKGKKQLKEYLEEGTIKPVTGDQVVYRLKQAGNAPEGTDAGGGRDTSAAQVAVLGSPTVPLGLSSALGYLHLGQVARIKVPPHLMQQGAADDTGEVAPRAPPAATAGSSRSAGSFKVIGGGAAEYELEVLAIVPGRGKLSGQPVLSDAARQQQQPLDIPALTQDTPDHLQPPKPLRGMSGWVRRHLSLNVRAPWKAGKRGLGWLGLRGCCKGQGKQKEDEQAQQRQQKPAYGSDA
ncbi:hypothetical protein OEZ86_012742 [Tetradesmus obliquus]|nr:hypothetical protein OEZ86_012742 [Tetradesmus obliquus]